MSQSDRWEPQRSAALLRKLARLNEQRGDYEEAMQWLGRALALLEMDPDAADPVEHARVLNDLGWVCFKRGDLTRAQELAYQSLQLLDNSGAVQDIASAYNRLVATYSAQGMWKEAHEFAHASFKLRQQLGFQPGIISSCHTMATLLIRLGQWQEARHYAEQMLATARATSARDSECQALLLLATLDEYTGHLDEALVRGQAAQTLAEELAIRPLLQSAFHTAAQIQQARGELRTAHVLSLRALEQAHLLGVRELEAGATTLHATVLMERGRLQEALREAEQALQMVEPLGVPVTEAHAHRVVGQCAMAGHDFAQAEHHLRAAGRLFARMNLRYELAQTELLMARLLARQGSTKEARALWQRALATFRQLGAMGDLRRATRHTRQDETEEASAAG